MDSSISPAQSASRKRRAFGAAFGTDNSYPYRSLELYHNESSGTGSANSSARDNSMLTSQSLHISSDSPPSLGQILDLPPHSPGSPQKKPSSPSATARRSRRWRHPRGLKWRVALVMLIFLLISGVLWIMHQDATAAPQSGSSHRRTGAATARRPQPSSTSAAATNAKKEHTAIEGKLPLHTTTTSTTTTTTIADAEPTNTTIDTTTTSATPITKPSTTTAAPAVDEKRSTWGVLVQHEDIIHRLRLHKRCGRATATNPCPTLYVDPRKLPSWTLHAIPRDCVDCTDPGLYAATTNGTKLQAHHGVFASTTGPLGRVGPMLYAMSSVTNDINVQEELPRWSWLAHVYPNFPTVTSGATENTDEVHEAPRPYLAVMGVPSTDQPARVALRTAQRATWMSYQEVARTENNFEGALLPLYVFAAVEPVSGKAPRSRIFDPEALTPSYASLKTATSTLLKEDATGADTYEERRVELRADWREAEETESASPCLRVSSVTVAGGAKSTPLSYLSAALSLPITPAAVAAAEYICHASAALWKEALTHRNVVWIDMMTDRRPTTDKKLGDTTKWGLPVEVGMSQKLVLWLSYAYHAFPNVPYIIKGDDDAYLKVPQFLSDIRYVRTGAVHRDTAPFGRSVMMNAMTAKAELLEGSQPLFETTTTTTTVEPAVLSADDSPECIYWGSMRSFHHIMFNAGMTFMAHRKLVRSVLGPVSLIADRIDIVNLAVGEFDSKKRRVYRSARLHQEDILLGLRIHAAKKHAREVCPGGKVWYIMEGLGRFHDMHRGKMHDVTWSTVVAHRCTPADTYFLHYYFQQEHLLNARGGTNLPSPNSREEEESPEEVEMDVEIRATKQAERWVAAKAESMPANVVGWDALPSVQWSHGEGSVPAYEVYDHDKVAVYHNVYEPWKDRANHVEYGYRAIPLE